MNKILYLIVFVLMISCTNKNQKNNDFSKSNKSSLKSVGDNLYLDLSTNHFYYDENDICHKSELSKSNQSFKLITDNENNIIKDIDINSFKSTNTFWYDRKYFFTIKDTPSNIEITLHPIDSVFSGLYFKDSKYRIQDNNLEYFGQKWESDEVLNCHGSPIIENVELNNFYVLNINENCSINAYGLYKEKFLFHGCWLNLDKLPNNLREKLINAKEKENFAQKIKI